MLVYLSSDRYVSELEANNAITCIITTEKLSGQIPGEMGMIVSPDPSATFYGLHNHLAHRTSFYGKDFDSVIGDGAEIHPSVQVAPQNIRIGQHVIIEPGVIIMGRCIIEDNAILRAGSIIGTHGFEFKRLGDAILPVHHAGGVMLRKGVEIQAFSNVDRAVFGGLTDVGENTKIGQHVYVAHHAKIGKRCMIAAHVMVGGSATVGDEVWVGPGAMISSNVTIGNCAKVSIGSVVTRNVPSNQTVSGNFAIDHNKFISFVRSIR